MKRFSVDSGRYAFFVALADRLVEMNSQGGSKDLHESPIQILQVRIRLCFNLIIVADSTTKSVHPPIFEVAITAPDMPKADFSSMFSDATITMLVNLCFKMMKVEGQQVIRPPSNLQLLGYQLSAI